MSAKQGRETEINFRIKLDAANLPETITWKATDGPQEAERSCKSIAIALWDKAERNTLRIDLWTKDMPIDEMHTHYLQNLMTLTESYCKATGNPTAQADMLKFCRDMADKIREFEAKRNENQGAGRS